MQNEYPTLFNRIGVKVDSAELTEDNTLAVVSTIAQFSKMKKVLATTLQGVEDNRVIAHVALDELEKAIAENAKAPRQGRSTSVANRITSKTVYEIAGDPEVDDVNELTYAEWDGNEGYALINDQNFDILKGIASDYYEIGETSDPERPVYAIQYNMFIEEEDRYELHVITAYSVSNLLGRVITNKEMMQ